MSTGVDTRGKKKTPQEEEKKSKGNSTPIGKGDSMEKLIAAMERMERGIRDEIRGLKDDMKKREIAWEQERIQTKSIIEGLEHRINVMEKKERKNNIIISNYDTQKKGKELVEEVENMLNSKIDKNVKVLEARSWKTMKGTMIMAKLNEWEDKLTIMKNKKEFKQQGGEDGDRNIYIDEDLDRNEREIRMKARRLRNNITSNGQKCDLKYERGIPVIYAENKKYCWDPIEKEYGQEKK